VPVFPSRTTPAPPRCACRGVRADCSVMPALRRRRSHLGEGQLLPRCLEARMSSRVPRATWTYAPARGRSFHERPRTALSHRSRELMSLRCGGELRRWRSSDARGHPTRTASVALWPPRRHERAEPAARYPTGTTGRRRPCRPCRPNTWASWRPTAGGPWPQPASPCRRKAGPALPLGRRRRWRRLRPTGRAAAAGSLPCPRSCPCRRT